VAIVERLLFGFRYDDGTTVVDRFVQRSGHSEAAREMARGFLDGVESFFEVLAAAPARPEAIEVCCCLSDLVHVVAPTEPERLLDSTPGDDEPIMTLAIVPSLCARS